MAKNSRLTGGLSGDDDNHPAETAARPAPSIWYMSKKMLNLLLVGASLIGYLEWGEGRSVFLFQAEAEMFSKALADPWSVIHPFTLLPVLGQLALLVTLFQRTPSKALTYAGIGGIGLLLGLMLFIGVIDTNLKIAASTLPFVVLSTIRIRRDIAARNERHQSRHS